MGFLFTKLFNTQLSIILFLTLMLAGTPSFAFINIESLRQNMKEGFFGSTGVDLSGSSGNARVFEIGGNSQNIYRKDKREFIAITNYNYGEASSQKNTHKGNVHLRYAQKFSTSWSWEVFGQLEFNEFQNLNLRSLSGIGLRIGLLQHKTSSIFLGTGTFYEDERIQKDDDQANFRGNIYLSLRQLFGEETEIVLVSYYQPSYKRIDDYRIQLTAGLEVKINKYLRIVNNIEYSKDSRPPVGVGQYDLSYSTGFYISY